MNYYNEYLKIINNLIKKENLLLHSCCAPCSSHVIKELSPYFNITILYYNPNIYPEKEYYKRKEEQKRFIKKLDNINFIDCDYDDKTFYKIVKGHENDKEGTNRCFLCYYLRLEKTAQVACLNENNFTYFTTTLSVSPYKNSIKINEIGKELEEKYPIKFLYSDFKKKDGYKDSILLSKKYNLYRQNYCGCKFSQKLDIAD